MKTLCLSIIAIFTLSSFFAYALTSTSIDGNVSLKGCNVINGTITQTTDIQNTTIQICNYHERHFKLIEETGTCPTIGFGPVTDPITGHTYNFPSVCDIPTTCVPQDSWGGPIFGHSEKLPVMVNGTQHSVIINYDSAMCASESYDAQEKRVTIVANSVWKNQTTISIIIPKDLVRNVTGVTVDGQNVIPFVTDYPTHDAIPACPESCYNVIIQLASSSKPEKIEIGAESIPEFPLAEVILVISIMSVISFYRIRFRQ